MSILCIGSMALDSIETPFGVRENILGGSATHFSVSASFLTDIQLVAVVGQDFPQEHWDFLAGRGVDLSGVERAAGETFRWQGRYGYDLNTAETLATHLNVFAEFDPQVPQAWLEPEFLFLGNIHPALQLKVLENLSRPRLVALDTMNFWIEGEPELLKQVISKVDLVVINDAECRQLAQQANVVKATQTIQSWGPKTVVVKQGEYGAVLFHEDRVFSAPAYPLEAVLDPTGAGDSFAGGLMGYLANTGVVDLPTLKNAVVMGSVMASFNVEDFSCDRMRQLTHAEIRTRYQHFKELIHFDVPELALRNV